MIVVVVAGAGAYLLLARSTTTQPSPSTSSLPSISVSDAVNRFVQNINERSVNGLVTFYTPSSVVHWSGNLGGLQGLYAGTDSIKFLYASTVGKAATMKANSINYAQKSISPTQMNASYDLVMLANSTVAGKLNATISVSQEWAWGNGGWQISKENWSYIHFDSSLLDAKYGSSTTFPQWGYEMKGGDPNLVSEKSFEWHAGPYLAAVVYAFLFGVIAALALKLRSTNRKRPTVAESASTSVSWGLPRSPTPLSRPSGSSPS
jgi:hypothetical protein